MTQSRLLCLSPSHLRQAFSACAVAAIMCSPSVSLAVSMVVESCDGAPRFSEEVSATGKYDLIIDGVAKDTQSSVELRDAAGGSAALSEGQDEQKLLFRRVSPGVYRVCPSSGGLSFDSVSLKRVDDDLADDDLAGAAFASSGLGVAGVAIGGLAAGGAAVAISNSDSSSARAGSGGEASSLNGPSSVVSGESVSSPVSVGGVEFDEADFGFGDKGVPLSPAT